MARIHALRSGRNADVEPALLNEVVDPLLRLVFVGVTAALFLAWIATSN